MFEIRIYTMNAGHMDEWVRMFTDVVVGIHEAAGVHVFAAWHDDTTNWFTWIRQSPTPEQLANILGRLAKSLDVPYLESEEFGMRVVYEQDVITDVKPNFDIPV